MLFKMVKCAHILLVLTSILIQSQSLPYRLEYPIVFRKSPIGFISREKANGEQEVLSSLGTSKIGVYRRLTFPVEQRYISPNINYPLYQPSYQPAYLLNYETGLKSKFKTIPKKETKKLLGRNNANHNSLVGGIHLSNLLGGLLGK